MKRIILLSVLGFLLALTISLFVGTRSFNRYCFRVQAGNIGGLAFRWGVEKSGFKNCVLNTPTLNLYIFVLTLYGVIFFLHAFLISQLGERNCFKNLARIFLICLLFNFLSYPFSFIFQRINYGSPLEGGIMIVKGKRMLFSLSEIQANYIPGLIFWLLLVFLISQIGLIIMTFLLNRFKLSHGYKPGIKSLLYVFVGAILFQLASFSLFISTLSFYNRNLNPKRIQKIEIQPLPTKKF